MSDHKLKRFSTQSLARKAGRIMLVITSIILACVLILLGVLEFWSYPGKPKPVVDQNGEPLPTAFQKKFLSISTE